MMICLDFSRGHFCITFKYEKHLVDTIKKIPGSRYTGKGIWKIAASRDSYTKIISSFIVSDRTDTAKAWIKENVEEAPALQSEHRPDLSAYKYTPKDYKFVVQPFDHQLICFNYFKDADHRVGGLLLEMGLGKTKIITDIFSYKKMKGYCNRLLYICPNSVTENSRRELTNHSPLKLQAEVVSGARSKKEEIILNKKLDAVIINYESVAPMLNTLMRGAFDIIVCDESTRIKNPQAQCSKAIHTLGKFCKQRYVMTGTPLTQNAIDIYSQYKFVDAAIFGPSFWAFKANYAIMGGYLGKQIIAYQNIDDLQKKIFSCSIRFTKKQCLDLPEKIYEKKYVELNAEERSLYKQITENILTEVKGQNVSATIMLTKITKLSQIASGFLKSDDGNIIRIKNPSKLAVLKETIQDILPNKTIIWCNFTDNITQIKQMCEELSIKYVYLDGSVPQADRQQMIDTFQNDNDCKVFIGQIRTGGLGITLTAATYVIYYTNTYSLADRLQSEDRAHRIGQKNNVTYIDIVCKDTIDESVAFILTKKNEFSKLIIDNIETIIKGVYKGEQSWRV
jgi:SNF2 family DNA or RNA helicase